jgi:hypothetical protein
MADDELTLEDMIGYYTDGYEGVHGHEDATETGQRLHAELAELRQCRRIVAALYRNPIGAALASIIASARLEGQGDATPS